MGCCKSSISADNEVQVTDQELKESGFFDVNLDSSNEMKGFDFEALHTTKSTCPTSRVDLNFLQSGIFNL